MLVIKIVIVALIVYLLARLLVGLWTAWQTRAQSEPPGGVRMVHIASYIERSKYQWRQETRPLGPVYIGALNRGFGRQYRMFCYPFSKRIECQVLPIGIRLAGPKLFLDINLGTVQRFVLTNIPDVMTPVIDAIQKKIG